MIQMQNAKFEDFAEICFWVMLITERHTHTHTKKKNQLLKTWFLDSFNLETCKSVKISSSKICPNLVSIRCLDAIHTGKRNLTYKCIIIKSFNVNVKINCCSHYKTVMDLQNVKLMDFFFQYIIYYNNFLKNLDQLLNYLM